MHVSSTPQMLQHSCGVLAEKGPPVNLDPGSHSWLLLWKVQLARPGGATPDDTRLKTNATYITMQVLQEGGVVVNGESIR
jgi:hypothetical protein